MRAALDDDLMQGFANRLDEINQLADASAGFVWRLQDDTGDATALRVFDDPLVLINISVWTDLVSLKNFVYHSIHRELIIARKKWFKQMDGPHLALWWVPAGHRPDAEEAKQKLQQLAKEGASEEVFTFASQS